MAINQDRAFRLLLRTIQPGSGDPAENWIQLLVEIDEARADVLTEAEYQEWRGSVFKQIVRSTGVPWALKIVLVGAMFVLVGVVAWSIAYRAGALAAGATGALIMAVFLWQGLYRDDRAKRKLTYADRLRVIDSLLGRRLVSEGEADALRSQLAEAFPANAS